MEAKKGVCGVCEKVILNSQPEKKAGCLICFSKNRFKVIKSGGETSTQKKKVCRIAKKYF